MLVADRTLGEALQERRAALGETAAQAAERLSVSQATWSRWENDEHEPTEDSLLALLEYLDLGVPELSDLIAESRLQSLREEMRRLERRLSRRGDE